MENTIDTEGNLFETLENEGSYEDQGNSLYEEMAEFRQDPIFNEEEEEEEDGSPEEEEEEDTPLSFDEEEEDDDEEEDDEITQEELDTLNKKLGTNFSDVESLKKSLEKKETATEESQDQINLTKAQSNISMLDRYIGMTSEELMLAQYNSDAVGAKKDINDPEVQQEIQNKIDSLKDLGELDNVANTLKANLAGRKEKEQAIIDGIDNKIKAKKEQTEKNNTANLQNALAEIFEAKEFHGVEISKKDIHKVYEDIRSDKFFQRVNNNQGMIAKLAMFLHLEDKIQVASNGLTHSDNVKNAFNTLAGKDGSQARSLKQASNSSASKGSEADFLSGFLK